MEQNLTQNLNQDIQKATSWFKVHEKLLIIFMVLIFAFFVADKGLSIVSSWEQHKATQAEKVLDAQKAKSDADLAQAKTMLADYESQIATAAKEITALTNAQAARDKVVIVQQKADAQLAPNDLALRWQGLVGDSGVAPAQAGDGYNISHTAAIATVQDLEQVPVLTLDLADEQSKTAALQKDVTDANALIDKGKIVVNGLQLTLTDQKKADTMELNAEKAKARKGKLKAFGLGFVAGFITGVTVHLW